MGKKILIVGAGLFGAICTRELSRAGHECQVVEKRDHIGGNCYTRYNADAACHEHVYGPHIFHTNSIPIWNYINQFARFNNFVNRVKVRHRNCIYSFPINLLTLHQMFGVSTPDEAQRLLARKVVACEAPRNVEDYCLSVFGRELYETFIEGYTFKQWNRHPRDLPASIVKRLPIRLSFDDNYFNDRYQGIPIGGYTAVFEKLLEGVRVDLGVDFHADREYWLRRFDFVIYTGPIDAFFDYRLGELPYRSLRFESELVNLPDCQGTAVVNYTDAAVPWTRIIEHKHFDLQSQTPSSLITREFPAAWQPGRIEYYPVVGDESLKVLRSYRDLALQIEDKVHFGGRLGEFRYYDMHQIVGSALQFVDQFLQHR